MTDNKDFEVIIIGGSYAGLSAAMALGRSLRSVLIIDSGRPCNRQTPYSHNFITQDGKPPGEISNLAKSQVEKYETVKFYEGHATTGSKTADGFKITTDRNDKFTGKKLVVATGIKDIMPDIKGFSECWGISVIHCPYCHGFEFRSQPTGIMADGERSFHLASLVSNLTDELSLIISSKTDFTQEQMEKLRKHNIEVIESGIAEIEHENGEIKKVKFLDGTAKRFKALYASLPFEQHSDIFKSLGCKLTEEGRIEVDQFGETNINGIYACGDNSNRMRSIASAVYSGNLVGAMVNFNLVEEEF